MWTITKTETKKDADGKVVKDAEGKAVMETVLTATIEGVSIQKDTDNAINWADKGTKSRFDGIDLRKYPRVYSRIWGTHMPVLARPHLTDGDKLTPIQLVERIENGLKDAKSGTVAKARERVTFLEGLEKGMEYIPEEGKGPFLAAVGIKDLSVELTKAREALAAAEKAAKAKK